MRAASAPMTGGVVPIARRGLVASARAASSRVAMFLAPPPRVGTNPADLRFARLASGASGFASSACPGATFASTGLSSGDKRSGARRAAARAASTSAASRGPEEAVAPPPRPHRESTTSDAPYDSDFWRAQVVGPGVKQSARLMARRLDHADPLGVDLTLRGASTNAGKRGGRKTLYDYALDVKAAHPRKVLLIRVGEFYEALGYDAVMLVMHAGLNPMGGAGAVPRAGCPLLKVQETLDRLTSKGFACVVCEEVPVMNPYGQRAPPKERYVAAIVTPASPQYVVGAADAGDDVAFDGDAPPPVVGVASGAVGYTVVSVEPDLRRVVVLEGLTAESAAARLASGGIAPPLYRHASLDAGFGARGAASAGIAGPTRRLRMEVGNIVAAAAGDEGRAATVRYDAKDPVDGLLDVVRREYGFPPSAEFETVGVRAGPGRSSERRPRPYPLSLATAQQLGVLPTRSVPPLLSHVLPPSAGAPAACRAYLQELLLHPPPRDTAEAIAEACASMTSLDPSDGGVPRLEIVPPAKIAKLLRTREGSHVFFAEVSAMAKAVRRTLEHDSPKVRRAGEAVLNPTSLKIGRRVDPDALARACAEAENIIAAVVAPEALESGESDENVDGDENESIDATVKTRIGVVPSNRVAKEEEEEGEAEEEEEEEMGRDDETYDETDSDSADSDSDDSSVDAPPRVPHVPRLYLRLNEPWRGRVRRDRVREEMETAEAAARELSLAIATDLAPLVKAAESARTPKNRRCHLEHDQRNNALWLRYLPAALAKEAKTTGIRDADGSASAPVDLAHPVDRWGKEIADRWSTPRVEAATEAYRVASARAGRAVADALKTLADDLGAHVGDLVGAATFSVVATAISLHATSAVARDWRPAALLSADDAATPWTAEGLFPFWMSRDAAVSNDVRVDGVTLLTGPNMAGKSTILRAVAASALLASCGLHVPARRAEVPHFDSLVVRMSSTDSPAEGLSSYAVEMAEVGQMLDVVTPRSLVFIDELGRGTEASHGTAMAGAVIEALDAAGARGVFATHLHGLLDLDLDLSPFARRARMETATVAGGRVAPTWRMVPGECRESLALQTAVDMGVNDAVVRRSEALLRRMIEREETAKTRVGGTASGDRGGEADESVAASTRTTAAPAPARCAPPLSELFASLVDAASSSSGGSIDPSTAGVVGVDDVPPAAARAWTCVYVLRRSDGWAYCGETDDLAGRLAAHRSLARRGGAKCDVECAFVSVPREAGGKSAARALETRVIERFRREGTPLLSGSDGRNTSFGSAGGGSSGGG